MCEPGTGERAGTDRLGVICGVEKIQMPTSIPRLSKSRYLAGLQGAKRLYLEVHARELAGEIDEGTQAVLDAGTGVGALARERYPNGALVEVEYFKVRMGSPARLRSWSILASPSSTRGSSPSTMSSSAPTSWCESEATAGG